MNLFKSIANTFAKKKAAPMIQKKVDTICRISPMEVLRRQKCQQLQEHIEYLEKLADDKFSIYEEDREKIPLLYTQTYPHILEALKEKDNHFSLQRHSYMESSDYQSLAKKLKDALEEEYSSLNRTQTKPTIPQLKSLYSHNIHVLREEYTGEASYLKKTKKETATNVQKVYNIKRKIERRVEVYRQEGKEVPLLLLDIQSQCVDVFERNTNLEKDLTESIANIEAFFQEALDEILSYSDIEKDMALLEELAAVQAVTLALEENYSSNMSKMLSSLEEKTKKLQQEIRGKIEATQIDTLAQKASIPSLGVIEESVGKMI